MGKARITYRFEHTTRHPNGQATETPVEPDSQSRQPVTEDSIAHVEFPFSGDPVVIEEKAPKKPASHVNAARISGADVPNDYGVWSDRSAEEIQELERLIRDADKYEPSRYEPARYESARYEPETGYWDRTRGEGRYKRPPRHEPGLAWWKVAGSIVGAIATGVVFGTFMLQFFTGDSVPDELGGLIGQNLAAPITDVSQSASAGAHLAEMEPSGAGGAASAGAVEAVRLPERRMFLLQNGMFETLEGARSLAEDMKSKGLAATIEEGERFYVYAGVMSQRDDALRAGVKLQAAGVEVYVKPYDLPPVEQVRVAEGFSEAFGEYIGKGSVMIQMIGDVTLLHLEEDAPVTLEEATLDKLKADHLALSEWSMRLAPGLPADAQPMLKRMDDAVRNAVVSIEEYGSHPDFTYLWSAQSALMDYIIAEKRLLTTIAVK